MTNKELYKYMDDLLKMHLTEQSKQNCVCICNKLTEWFGKNAVTVNINQWMQDYTQGFDTAKEDIKEFAKNHYDKFIDKRTQWDAGYRHAMMDVIEHIERM